MNVNTYEIFGRLGADCEIKILDKSKVLSFSLGIDRGYYDKEKKVRIERVEWIRVNKFYQPKDEIKIAQYLGKGALVLVSGIPKAESWIKEGVAHGALSLTGRDINLLASKLINKGDEASADFPPSDTPQDDLPY